MAEFLNSGTDVIFIDYIDIVRSPWVKIFEYIHENKDDLEEFFNFDNMPREKRSTLAWSLIRENVNGLYDFGTDNYSFDDILLTIEDQIPDLYENSELLEIGNFIDMIAARKSTKAVYLYTEYYDSRIDYDINSHFTEGKIYYKYGDFYEVIEEIKPTFFILNEISQVNALLTEHQDVVRGREILLTKHFYNFRIDTNNANYLVPDIDEELGEDILEKLHVDLNLFRSINIETAAFNDERIFTNTEIVYFDDDGEVEHDEIDLEEIINRFEEAGHEANRQEENAEEIKHEMEQINDYLENNMQSFVRVIHNGDNETNNGD